MVYKRGKTYGYKFTFRGELIRRSTKQGNQRVAGQMEAACLDGESLTRRWVRTQHGALRALLGLPAEFAAHSLPHTFGTRLGESGADAFSIMRLMGHSSITVPRKYVHPAAGTLERAIDGLSRLNGSAEGSQNRAQAEKPSTQTTEYKHVI